MYDCIDSVPKGSGRRVKRTSKMATVAKKTQKLIDHVELLSAFQNVDTALYIAPLDTQQEVFEQNRILNQCTSAVQIACVESYLLRLFGENVANTTSDEDKFRQFMHDASLHAVTRVTKFQAFSVTVTAPSGTLLCLLEDVLSDTAAKQSMVISAATHYLLQCCCVLNMLSSTLFQRTVKIEVTREGSEDKEKEKQRYSFEANVELIYVLFKNVNLLFNILLESAYAPAVSAPPSPASSPSKKRHFDDAVASSPLQQSVAVAKRSLLNDENAPCLLSTPAVTATTTGTPTATSTGLSQLDAVQEACTSFLDAVNEFKSFLRKRMGAMGSTIEVRR